MMRQIQGNLQHFGGNFITKNFGAPLQFSPKFKDEIKDWFKMCKGKQKNIESSKRYSQGSFENSKQKLYFRYHVSASEIQGAGGGPMATVPAEESLVILSKGQGFARVRRWGDEAHGGLIGKIPLNLNLELS